MKLKKPKKEDLIFESVIIDTDLIFESKMNKELPQERFLIIESSIGFNSAEFNLRIIDELNFLGMDQDQIAESCYIPKSRMKSLISGRVKYLADEISTIKKRLGMD
jgi:hypothetical protein